MSHTVIATEAREHWEAEPLRARDGTLTRLLKNPEVLFSGAIIFLLIIMAFAAPIFAPFNPTEQHLIWRLQPPGFVDPTGGIHWAGTDQFGRDVLSRLIYGVRVPLIVGFGAALLGGALGLVIGLPAGYFGRRLDHVIGFLIDVQLSMPFILVAMMIIVLFGPSAWNIILVFTFSSWPLIARVARAAALGLRSQQFIEAAQSAGAGHASILIRHVLPNALPAVVVVASAQVAAFVIYESAFGFFGLGVPPPEPTWGNMLADARSYLTIAPWMSLFPGLCIAAVALAANLFGDGLRDVMDPRNTQTGSGG